MNRNFKPMTNYRNVLIEIQDKDLEIKQPLRAFIDHDESQLAGGCGNIQVREDGLFVDINSLRDLSGYYPAIKYVKDLRILAIGLSKTANIDPRIPAIG